MKINLSLVKDLIKEQFPEFLNLKIKSVKIQGHDNRTFRLGNEMLIRLPSAERYSKKVAKEQMWLPKINNFFSVKIPKPLFLGEPSNKYPFNWSIYKWINGNSINEINIENLNLEKLALDLSKFLNELQKINIFNETLLPGAHNFYRGGNLLFYDSETKISIQKFKNIIDIDINLIEEIWEKAISSKWKNDPVPIHGDLAIGNILIENNELKAIIDFSGFSIGDPSCDLVLYWTFFDERSRKIFKDNLFLDEQTWERARGWALWKCLITLVEIKDLNSNNFINQKKIFDTILKIK